MRCTLSILVLMISYLVYYLYTTTPEDYLLTARQFIKKFGYNCHAHTIETQDGFVITIFRLMHKDVTVPSGNRTPVLIGGALFLVAEGLLHNGPKNDLPYILLDAGFDVWVINHRGSHTSYAGPKANRSDPYLYDFSYHEMAIYDLTAIIDRVLNITEEKRVDIVAPSMMSAVALALLSTKPEYNDKVGKLLHLGGAHAFSKNLALGTKIFYYLLKDVPWLLWIFANQHPFRPYLMHLICGSWLGSVCIKSFEESSGLPSDNSTTEEIGRIFALAPPGEAHGVVAHIIQSQKYDGEFRMRDWGPERNRELYHSETPPLYKVDTITVYSKAYVAIGDKLADNQAAWSLFKQLPNIDEKFTIQPPFEHYNFVCNQARSQPMVEDIIKTLRRSDDKRR